MSISPRLGAEFFLHQFANWTVSMNIKCDISISCQEFVNNEFTVMEDTKSNQYNREKKPALICLHDAINKLDNLDSLPNPIMVFSQRNCR